MPSQFAGKILPCCRVGILPSRARTSLYARVDHQALPFAIPPRRSPKDRAKTPFLRAFGCLRVDNGYCRARLPAFLLAHRNVQFVMDALQRAILVPELKIVMHRALGRQILG